MPENPPTGRKSGAAAMSGARVPAVRPDYPDHDHRRQDRDGAPVHIERLQDPDRAPDPDQRREAEQGQRPPEQDDPDTSEKYAERDLADHAMPPPFPEWMLALSGCTGQQIRYDERHCTGAAEFAKAGSLPALFENQIRNVTYM